MPCSEPERILSIALSKSPGSRQNVSGNSSWSPPVGQSALAVAPFASSRRGNPDRQLFAADHLADRKLHRIAEIDGHVDRARSLREHRRQRQEIGDARDDDRDGMNVDPGDMLRRLERALSEAYPLSSASARKTPDRVKQERSRAASGIEDLLFERCDRRHRLTHFRGQPIRGVILAESVPLRAIDQRLVELLITSLSTSASRKRRTWAMIRRTSLTPSGSATTQSKNRSRPLRRCRR